MSHNLTYGIAVPPVSAELVQPVAATPPSLTAAHDRRAEVAERWLRAKGTTSEHTPDRYRRDIAAFFAWADSSGFDVFALQPWQMSEFAAAMKDEGRLKASTRAGRLAAVSSFYRFVQRNVERAGYFPNPAEYVDRPKFERRKSTTRGLSAAELANLRAEALRRGSLEYALVQLLAGAGLRVSEMLGADARHLRRDGGSWYLEVKRKGLEDRVSVEVPDPAARAIRRHLAGRAGPLFLDRSGNRMTRQAAANRVRSIALAAGISGKNVTPHSLRHAFATLALGAMVPIRDVQVQMGHATVETTARYDRALRERDNPAVAAIGRLIADDLGDSDD